MIASVYIGMIHNCSSQFLSIVSKHMSNSAPLPPGPTPWPLLGNIPHMIGPSPHVTLTNFAKIYGPLISLKLGEQCLIVGSSPEAAKELLKTKDRISYGRYVPQSISRTKSELNRSSLVWADECNSNWKSLRSLCSDELFSNKAMDSRASMMETHITDLICFLRDRDQGEVVKVAEIVFATIFNMLGNALMSKDFIILEGANEDASGLKGVIRKGLEATAAPNLADWYPSLRSFDLQRLRKEFCDFTLRMKALWEPVIERRRRERKAGCYRHEDLLDSLLEKDFSNDQIDVLFTEVFAGGTETTTSTIEWTMAELLKNPECMKRAQAEIEREIKHDFPKNFNSMRLPYLQACIKETLRLHPATPFSLPHKALETCQVMNYMIPKDAEVLVNLWAISRDPSTWKRPLKFRPERFLGSDIDFRGNDFEFLPFGAGRRICLGLPMAARNIPLILVSLIHFFDWSLPSGKDSTKLNMNEKFSVTIMMERPLVLLFQARKT